MRYAFRNVLVLGGLSAVACGGEENEPALDEGFAQEIMILSPVSGADFDEGTVRIVLGATGVDIVPAGMEQDNAGHHHLFINREITPPGETIPAEEGIVHLGAAQTEYEFTDLEPGEYTVTAVLGDHLHVRIPEIAPASVTFVIN